MEPGYRTPLVDFFRRGEVARDVRLLAAQGALAPRVHEQLTLLVLLVADDDPEIAATAETTLDRIPAASLAAFLARPDAGSELREFFAGRGVRPAETPAPDAEQPLVDTSSEDASDKTAEGAERSATVQRLAGMPVAERMRAAMKGTREERAILIRDPNKMVALAVLSSPKLTEHEVEAFARMATVSEDVLRTIAQTRAWVRNYAVVLGLIRNPKSPLAISMKLLPRLVERDVRLLSTDRNVPEPLRVAARQKIVITDRR